MSNCSLQHINQQKVISVVNFGIIVGLKLYCTAPTSLKSQNLCLNHCTGFNFIDKNYNRSRPLYSITWWRPIYHEAWQLNKPTKTNTNNNSGPVIQLRYIKAYPIFGPDLQPSWRKRLACNNFFKVVGSSLTQVTFFYGKDFKSPKTQLILLSMLAYGLG